MKINNPFNLAKVHPIVFEEVYKNEDKINSDVFFNWKLISTNILIFKEITIRYEYYWYHQWCRWIVYRGRNLDSGQKLALVCARAWILRLLL